MPLGFETKLYRWRGEERRGEERGDQRGAEERRREKERRRVGFFFFSRPVMSSLPVYSCYVLPSCVMSCVVVSCQVLSRRLARHRFV